MFSARKFVAGTLSVSLWCTLALGGLKEVSKATAISGGEDHTLILTANDWVWVCGPNGDSVYQDYYGVLGTGSASCGLVEASPVRVHDGDMATDSEHLEGISEIAAGWKHSLALDANGFVWSWGWNSFGQLGDETFTARTSPVQVLRGEQAPEDPNNPDPNLTRIVGISAGRSGEHSLAADVNGYAYAWVYNEYGQCGKAARTRAGIL